MINKVILLGRLGKDPEVKALNNGSRVASFTVATDESYKNKSGEKVELTEWHNVVVWNPGLADVIEKYVTKGTLVYLEGKIKTRTWEKDGQKNYVTEVVLDFGGVFKILSSKAKDQVKKEETGLPESESKTDEGDDDSLPF